MFLLTKLLVNAFLPRSQSPHNSKISKSSVFQVATSCCNHPLALKPVSPNSSTKAPMTRDTTIGGGCGAGGRGHEALGFAIHVVRGRWITIFSSFLVMVGAGGTYVFGIYSEEIKASLGYDQSTLNLVGFFKGLGTNVGVVSGLIAEVTPTWCLLLIGSAMNFGGFFMIWLAVTGKTASPKVWQMCLYIFIGANSQNFANTGVLVTCVRNFPENRGVLLGLLKGFAGLGAAIMTQIYLAIYGNDATSLILLVGWLPAAISVVSLYTIREMRVVKLPNELRVFYHFLFVSIVLALFLMAMTITQKLVAFSWAAYAGSATVICALLVVPLFVAIKEELVLWNQKRYPSNPTAITIENLSAIERKPEVSELSSPTKVDDTPKTSWFASIVNKPKRGEDYSILQALLSMDMLILFIASMCGIGSSLTVVDNLGQIGESLGYPTKTIKCFVSLVSIWNYFGRIFAGFFSENLLHKYKFPRPLMTTLVLFLSCIGHLLIAFPVPGSVYVASVIIGFSFGAQVPLMDAIVSELFGLKHYSTLFNCGQLVTPLASYILNVKVTGLLYDQEALKELARKGRQRSLKKQLTCIGTHCYRLSSIILAGVTCFGALASLILVARTREFYKGDIYKKFKEKAEADEMEMDSPSEGGVRTNHEEKSQRK
ncbi:unnamed protein product [Ilex paraguariensis]|uniref:Nodulin-like domain-containing protein n=1 Tax=Ilex paraguariensis TaxID=185542 RepID=A0ABC8UP35_9AQUA